MTVTAREAASSPPPGGSGSAFWPGDEGAEPAVSQTRASRQGASRQQVLALQVPDLEAPYPQDSQDSRAQGLQAHDASAQPRQVSDSQGSGRQVPFRPVKARSVLTPESVVSRGGLEAGSADAAAVGRLLAMQRAASRARAALLGQAALFWVDRDDPDLVDDRAEADLAVAIALRTTTSKVAILLRDAHLAVTDLPRTFARLAEGDMPVEWFDKLLRAVRDLTAYQRDQIDQRVAAWDLASIPADRFTDELRLLRAWFDTHEATRARPEDARDVSLELSGHDDGIACLRITGPIPEIHSLAARLDAAARAVQTRQRHALASGAPVPFDLDGDTTRTQRPLPLAALQYAVMNRTMLDTGGIEVPEPAHRVNVVVPVLTLMGLDDAPATYDGVAPLPAAMARRLAAGQKTWHRILTDPTSGQFLPLPADQYRPTTAMVEHLRLRDPVCAAPACGRVTSSNGENDHICEFDHAHPARGGPTSLDNLHRLDFGHHATKTAKRIDPVRNRDGTTTWSIGAPERARITTAPRRDLLSPEIATALSEAWDHYQWLLDLDEYDRSGQTQQFLHEGGPEDPHTHDPAHDPGPDPTTGYDPQDPTTYPHPPF